MALEYLKTIGRAKELISEVAQSPVGEVTKMFATNMIQRMKDQLASANRNANGSLSQSLSFEIEQGEGRSFTIEFLANEYWDFINSGVNGVERNFGSPYSFKTLNPSPEMLDSFTGTGSLRGWMAARGITTLSYINKDGKNINKSLSTEKDFEQAAWVFAKAVKRNGIRPTAFLDDTFNEEALEKFEDDIFEAFEKML